MALIAALTACLITCMQGAVPQNPTPLVERLEGQKVEHGQPEWDELHKLIVTSFPANKPFTETDGTYFVWRVRSEDLVFQATSPKSTDGGSFAGFYWFDLHSAPLSASAFATGHRLSFENSALVNVPGISGYVVEATLNRPLGKPVQVFFGFTGYTPLLLRYGYTDGSLIQNPFDVPSFTCGPKPAPYLRSTLLEALSSGNPLLQLQALTWLSGRHSSLSADILDLQHEPIADSVNYWSLSNDSSVAQAAATLASSSTEWVAQAAKFYVSVNRPQSVPSINLKPRLKDLSFTDIRLGHAADFDDPNATVKAGDRAVIEYDVKLPIGATAFTSLVGTNSPSVFRVGGTQVIDGLSKGIVGMKVGGLRSIEIPAAMAYGDAGADVIPPGADLTYRVKLLHIATEPPFGMGAEKVLRTREVATGRGAPVNAGATVRVNCKAFRLDGRPIQVPEITGTHKMVLFTGSAFKKALIGMKVGGLRRLLVNFPNIIGSDQTWFHYGAEILEVKLLSIVSRR